MQFKHPELFWALLLLLVPLIIHLFQFRRFKRTPFTNVKWLKQVVIASRKSNTLKKWLLLALRMLLFAALVFAFAQPFLAKDNVSQKQELVVYLDNSFSMQAKRDGMPLLQGAVQELMKALPPEGEISLFTNDRTFAHASMNSVRNELLALPYVDRQLTWEQVSLKAQTLFSKIRDTEKHLVVVSDFQQRPDIPRDSMADIRWDFVALKGDAETNVSLDTLYYGEQKSDYVEVTAGLSTSGDTESIPVSLYNNDTLIAKTSASFVNHQATAKFSLPRDEKINGRLAIMDAGLTYDNTLYFNSNRNAMVKVMEIKTTEAGSFLQRIYTSDEFQFQSFALDKLNYSLIPQQNLIVVHGLGSIPGPLSTALNSFVENGGHIVVIPPAKVPDGAYRSWLEGMQMGSLTDSLAPQQKVTQIAFGHPLFQGVFTDRVSNFQYPTLNAYFPLKTNLPKVLSFANGAPFLVGGNGRYLFTAALEPGNGNFTASPLVVPTFYAMGVQSLRLPKLYTLMGKGQELDVPIGLEPDHILTLTQGEAQFIPPQRSYANRTSLLFDDVLETAGDYVIKNGDSVVMRASFNYSRNESHLPYLGVENTIKGDVAPTVSEFFTALEKDHTVTPLWKWFVILALLFVLAEVLILKYFK